MADRPISPEARLRDWLARVTLPPDGRLPPERSLSVLLGLSRAELRGALAAVEAEGRLVRQVGRGTFLLGGGAEAGTPAPALASPRLADVLSPRQVFQARLAIEPELARMAALEATEEAIRSLESAEATLREARGQPAFAEGDAALHAAIARAAGHPLLLAVAGSLAETARSLRWGRLVPDRSAGPDDRVHEEHRAIVRAIAERDREGAAAAMRRHLIAEATLALGASL